QGGENYFKYRQIELLPDLVPVIADALAKARMVTISGGENGGAANSAAGNITSVIQTVLAAQLVSKTGLLGDVGGGAGGGGRGRGWCRSRAARGVERRIRGRGTSPR